MLALFVGGLMLYLRHTRPRKLAEGEWLVVDHADGPIRNVVGLVLLFAITPLLVQLGVLFKTHYADKPGAVYLTLFVAVAVYVERLWKLGRKVIEGLNAAPGELRTEHWPLAAGEQTAITYRRKLNLGVPAGEVNAYLVHYEIRQGHDLDGRHANSAKSKFEVKRVQLQQGEATYRNKEMVATWRFQVPNPMGNPFESLERLMWDRFFDRHREKEWWELHVKRPLRDGGMLDSQFVLPIEMIQGRSVMRLGN
jgi:hypothetical protein